ncbi:FAS-associated factor 2 [Culicoides brevitarsis]|uniref:FAS-associated factor 2 n=1 Tax=Culicoides brevitarsis TaxID=469753 RepID=UPI00307C98D5
MDSFDETISPSQTVKVQQFQEITGIDDVNRCRDILIRNGWDLEVAMQEEMNLREGRPSLYATESRPPAVINDRFLQQVFTTKAPVGPPQGFGGLIGYVVNLVFNFCYSTLTQIFTTFIDIFRGQERIVTDPVQDVLQFIQTFKEKNPIHPVFYQGTYSQALNDAKRELKFLLILIHSEQKTESVNFCRDTLSNPEVIEYINHNMILWGCDVASPEGFRVSHSTNARNVYPTMLMICLRNNKMTIVGRLEGNCTPEELLRRIRSVVQENDIYLTQQRLDRLERSLNQSIRQQQDAAYELSLKADQEKERKKQEELAKQKRIQDELEAEKQAEHQRKVDIENMKLELASTVPSEPLATDEGVVMLVFKLPSGVRLERRFLSKHSLKDICTFIFCHPDAPDCFEITTNFPKRVLITSDAITKETSNSANCDNSNHHVSSAVQQRSNPEQTTMLEAGLKNREVLFINDLDA